MKLFSLMLMILAGLVLFNLARQIRYASERMATPITAQVSPK